MCIYIKLAHITKFRCNGKWGDFLFCYIDFQMPVAEYMTLCDG